MSFFPQALLDGFSFGAGEQKEFPVGKIVFGPKISTTLLTNVPAPKSENKTRGSMLFDKTTRKSRLFVPTNAQIHLFRPQKRADRGFSSKKNALIKVSRPKHSLRLQAVAPPPPVVWQGRHGVEPRDLRDAMPSPSA